MTVSDLPRRRFIKHGIAAITIAGIAGCVGDDDENGNNNGENGDDPDSIATDWASSAPNWDGEIHDFTGQASVTVENGQPSRTDPFFFEPPAIRIDTGTTVTWTWIDDQNHSVTEDGNAFDSGDMQGEGTEFEHTFDEAGVYLYYCRPHLAANQRGAVIVE